MELKLGIVRGDFRASNTFNRTTMELKPRVRVCEITTMNAFNRTTMELKQGKIEVLFRTLKAF